MTTIRLHDSMTRQKRVFEPIDPQNVRLYVCGPTVYDRAHIGNGRAAVTFDVLFRLLRYVYGADCVTYVRNITDIDDKIMARAAESGRPIDAITAETAQWYQDDMAALGCLAPTHQPRATEHVGDMIAMIERLIGQGNAYEAQGHVLFDVDAFPDYGRLSGRSTDDMIAGARVEVAPYKRNPMDFVLWKPSAPDQPGWASPWGRGRPGWHIECSAMARELLGLEFDIHGGGSDLMFPHHENEIAQSRCAEPGHAFARYWLHNAMLDVDGRKMSKSLGNFFTVHDKLEEGLPGEVIRMALLMTHYRDRLDWTEQRVEEARQQLTRFYNISERLRRQGLSNQVSDVDIDADVVDALRDDLNTPLALAHINRIAKEAQAFIHEDASRALTLIATLNFLGFVPKPPFAKDVAQSVSGAFDAVNFTDRDALGVKIEALLAARTEARKAKDFGKADAIRNGLDAAGVVVMDRPGAPTEWELGPNFDATKLAEIAE
jgi:cysteinyl-tRNA synthetase